jgi:hypothetical protein
VQLQLHAVGRKYDENKNKKKHHHQFHIVKVCAPGLWLQVGQQDAPGVVV